MRNDSTSHNKLLQLSLMDCAEVSLTRNPVAVNGAAELGRYAAMDSFSQTSVECGFSAGRRGSTW